MIDLAEVKALFLDMDGVLWRSGVPLVNIAGLFQQIERMGFQVVCITNNSTKIPDQYLKILKGFGVHLEPWQVISSSQAAADYLVKQLPEGSWVHVVGEEGLFLALKQAGFKTKQIRNNPDLPAAVIVGMDRKLDYNKIDQAAGYVRKGARLIGTNPDKTFPSDDGLKPGAGTCIAAVETASGQKAEIIGKPEEGIFQSALDRGNWTPDQVLMIGDRLDTDILGAQELGIAAGLVLTGVTDAQQAAAWDPQPDLIAADVDEIIVLLKQL